MGERGDGGGGGAAAGGTATLGDLETTVELEELILAAKTDPLTSLSALTPQGEPIPATTRRHDLALRRACGCAEKAGNSSGKPRVGYGWVILLE